MGTSAEFWTNLEAKYRLHIAQKEAHHPSETSEIARRSHLYSFAPVAEMIKRGWIQATDSIDELEQQVCRFFEIDQIGKTPKLAVNCRRSEKLKPQKPAMAVP